MNIKTTGLDNYQQAANQNTSRVARDKNPAVDANSAGKTDTVTLLENEASRANEYKVTPQTDTVTLSEDAYLHAEAYKVAEASPDVNAEKVARLKQEVENSTYTIDSKKIAAKMIDAERGFY